MDEACSWEKGASLFNNISFRVGFLFFCFCFFLQELVKTMVRFRKTINIGSDKSEVSYGSFVNIEILPKLCQMSWNLGEIVSHSSTLKHPFGAFRPEVQQSLGVGCCVVKTITIYKTKKVLNMQFLLTHFFIHFGELQYTAHE